MALASYVLMFAGSSQTFVGYATAQEAKIYRTFVLCSLFSNGMFASQEDEGAVGAVSDESSMLSVGQ
jgi:hypothetical protein